MNNRWFVSVLLIFTVLIVCIGGVSAADNISDNQTVSDVGSGFVVSDSQVVDSDDSVVGQENSISDDNQNQILGDSNEGIVINSSADLDSVLNDQTVNNTVIYLNNQSLVLNDEYSVEYRNLTFCGGRSLNDDLVSNMQAKIRCDYSNLNFLRVNFIDKSHFVIDNSNSSFENCIFKLLNDTSEDIYYPHSNLILKNCTFLDFTRQGTQIMEGYYDSNTTVYNCIFKNLNLRNSYIFKPGLNLNININNCSFENIKDMGNHSSFIIGFMSGADNNVYVNNSKFSNNSVRCIYSLYPDMDGKSNLTVNNTVFSNNNDSSIFLNGIDITVNITNSTFVNNSAKSGSAICSYGADMSINNCNFINNSAMYGTICTIKIANGIHFRGTNMNINNSKFVNNTAFCAGGALSLSGDNTTVNNSLFENNKAGVCGGAIVIGNSTNTYILNSEFDGNNGSDYGNDLYYYYGNLSLSNNSEVDIYNNSNDTVTDEYEFDYDRDDYYVINNKTGFCLELHEYFSEYNPRSYFHNTKLAINSKNHKYVGNYIKYLIYHYYGKISNDTLVEIIWCFTNGDYEDPDYRNNYHIFFTTDKHYGPFPIGSPRPIYREANLNGNPIEDFIAIVNDTYNSVNNGEIIPDHGATKVNDDGTVTVYNFDTLLAPECQNIILFDTNNLTVNPDVSIIKVTNNRTVYKGNDTSFDIVVTNNGTVMLSNVTVTEDSYDDLVYKSSSNITGNWTYDYVNGKHTWTLVGYLGVNQTARFNVVFSTGNSTLGNKTNTVSVTTNENVTGNASNITEVIENNTPETPENNTPNTTENNTPNKPTPVDNGTVENNDTQKADIKTDEATGYPFIPLIIALIGIIGVRTRRR